MMKKKKKRNWKWVMVFNLTTWDRTQKVSFSEDSTTVGALMSLLLGAPTKKREMGLVFFFSATAGWS